jgi:tRNA-guanine family transglycosylase
MSVFVRHTHGWWNSQSPFKYPYAFASYPTHKRYRRLRDEWGFDPDVLLFSDSGGYSLLTGAENIDPYDLAEWYNTAGIDVGMSLDYPPYSDPSKRSVAEFDKRLEFTVRSSKILLDNVRSSVKLYATIHGQSYKQYDVWRHGMLMLSDDWFGWAFAISPAEDPSAVLRIIRYLESIKNDRPVHFFQAGSAVCFLLAARYANKRDLFVTADSTHATSAARKGWDYLTIFSLRTVPVGRKIRGPEGAVERVDCPCPVCQRYGPNSVRDDYEVLDLHNTYLLTWRSRFLNAISTEKPELIKLVLPEAVPYVRQLDAILEKRGGGLLDYA